jgi:hypothetical protein
MGWSDIQKQAQDITIYWLGWQLLDLVRLSATGLLVSAAGWVLSQWRNSGWQGEFRGALLALSALTIVLAFLTPRSALPQSGQAGVSHLSTPIQMTTVVTPQPRNEYQNEMDIKETIATAEKLGFLFSQTPNTTLVITAPPENDVFKRDFEALVLAASRWNGKDSCIIEPAPPNLAADLDSGMPESPRIKES